MLPISYLDKKSTLFLSKFTDFRLNGYPHVLDIRSFKNDKKLLRSELLCSSTTLTKKNRAEKDPTEVDEIKFFIIFFRNFRSFVDTFED